MISSSIIFSLKSSFAAGLALCLIAGASVAGTPSAHAHAATKAAAHAAVAPATTPAAAATQTTLEGTVVALKKNLLGQVTRVGIKDAKDQTFEVAHGPMTEQLLKLVGKHVSVRGTETAGKAGHFSIAVMEIASK